MSRREQSLLVGNLECSLDDVLVGVVSEGVGVAGVGRGAGGFEAEGAVVGRVAAGGSATAFVGRILISIGSGEHTAA